MSPEIVDFIPLMLVAPFLAAMAYGDLRHLRIPNRLVMAMATVFAVSAPFILPFPEIGFRLATALVVLALGFAGFALGLWGGGDVKAFSALMLFVPSSTLTIYAYTFSASMLIGMATVLMLRAVVGAPGSAWSSLRPNAGFPMGVSIALSGLLLPASTALFSH